MKFIKGLILGAILGSMLGAGVGINLSQGRPLASNPLESKMVRAQMATHWQSLLRYGRVVISDMT